MNMFSIMFTYLAIYIERQNDVFPRIRTNPSAEGVKCDFLLVFFHTPSIFGIPNRAFFTLDSENHDPIPGLSLTNRQRTNAVSGRFSQQQNVRI